MATKTGKKISDTYPNDLAINQATGVGVDSTTRNVHDGLGQGTSISLSDDVFSVQPVNDDSAGAMVVQNQAGAVILQVDTSDSLVKVGHSRVNATTQYAHFFQNYVEVPASAFSADTHYMIKFSDTIWPGTVASFALGTSTTSSFNDTNPASSLTISNTAMDVLCCYWYVMDNITIDEVKWFHAADTATGDSTAAHLMAYTVDVANGSTSGDLSGGTVVADGATITNAGYEQIYYQPMTIQSADVDAGKVILFTFASDTVNSDYSINATVKYHIR